MAGTEFHEFLGVEWEMDKWRFRGGNDEGVDERGVGTSVTVVLPHRHELCGPSGMLEGGIVSTIIDIAGATAAMRAFQDGIVATEHMTTSFLAPGRIGPYRAVGVVLRVGRHDAVSEVRVTDAGKDDRLMAVGMVTIRRLEGAYVATGKATVRG